jgi:hypothetical protein
MLRPKMTQITQKKLKKFFCLKDLPASSARSVDAISGPALFFYQFPHHLHDVRDPYLGRPCQDLQRLTFNIRAIEQCVLNLAIPSQSL